MPQRTPEIEDLVLKKLIRLNATVWGLVAGLTAGLGLFVATNWLVLKGGPVVGPHLSLLGQFFVGYRVTFWGSLIGFAYAFVAGFLIAYLAAKVHNHIADRRENRNHSR